jgi:enterochelin esterase family protein
MPTDSVQPLPGQAGSEQWWRQMATRPIPLCQAGHAPGDPVAVTFLWRDPQGDETTSPVARVYIDINSVTDHHSNDPQSLARIPGTDVWQWQVTLPADWRGSYVFIPVGAQQLPDLAAHDRQGQRRWWRSIMAHAVADPFNPPSPHAPHTSILAMPGAPDQSAWRAFDRDSADADPTRLSEVSWHSMRLGEQRRAWVYRTGDAPSAPLPLVWLLDGQRWAVQQPVFAALDADTARGKLAPAIYVLVDAIDGERRERDLSCSRVFWNALHHELHPLLARAAGATLDPAPAVVAGQSLGGLAATFAGLHWPERYGSVLSQSGSFWWPDSDMLMASPGQACPRQSGASGALAREVAGGALPPGRLRIFQEVGSHEDVMIDVNDSMHAALAGARHELHYQQFAGGHDWACWRGGLLDGLAWLLTPPTTMNENTL